MFDIITSMKMRPDSKEKHDFDEIQRFVTNYVLEHFCADCLNQEFVTLMIEKFNFEFVPQVFGSHMCPKISQVLSKLYKNGVLERRRVGISEGPGFPKWVYSYSLPDYLRKAYIEAKQTIEKLGLDKS